MFILEHKDRCDIVKMVTEVYVTLNIFCIMDAVYNGITTERRVIMVSRSERLQKIQSLVDSTGYLTTTDIAAKLNVSTMTVRRDLKDLDTQNLVLKVYGGAQSITKPSLEFTTNEKMNNNVSEKKDIALKLAHLIPNGSTIFLGAGTTLFYAVSVLKNKHLTVVTNSLPSFKELASAEERVILCGGELYKKTSEFLGPIAEKALDDLNIDYALGSTNGISGNQVTTHNSLESGIQNKAFQRSKKTVIVADHTKLNHSDTFTFRNLSDFDYLVTDSNVSSDIVAKYSQYTKILY